MGWRDLLVTEEVVTLPWTGGRELHSYHRVFKLDACPREFGWFEFDVRGNLASKPRSVTPSEELVRRTLKGSIAGYLVGDHLVADDANVDPDPSKIVEHSERVYAIPDGLDRFSRVRAGRVYPEGPLIFLDQVFPLGPEDDVMNAYLDERDTVSDIPDVVPALDAAFRMETYQRAEAERRRVELARKRAEEEARLAKQRERDELLERLGDGAGRREMAKHDFAEAAKAALAVGGAHYLDHRASGGRGEWAVKYRVDGQRLECVCDTDLQIIDAGVCLTDHNTGEKGDRYFTLESLPAVIRQAIREQKLVIWRHV